MKYKVADKVRVRQDLSEVSNDLWLVKPMLKFVGKIVTIKTVHKNHYRIEEDGCEWAWLEGALEPITTKSKTYSLIITNTNKVIILDPETKSKGVAECHPDDMFDELTGIELAWKRLKGVVVDTESKLYDSNGVELKEGNLVCNIVGTSHPFLSTIIKVNGALYNYHEHNSDINGGKVVVKGLRVLRVELGNS